MPTRISAVIPLPRFKVKDLLALKAGQVLHSTWDSATDVLLRADDVHISWTEFEVVEQNLAVRITRLA